MSVHYELIRAGGAIGARCEFFVVWQDIPLHRSLLALRLTERLPPPADWQTAAGSEAGLRIYQSYISLSAEWLDTVSTPSTALDRVLDCELEQIVGAAGADTQGTVRVCDAVETLQWLLERIPSGDEYAVERALALGVRSLCSMMSSGADSIRRVLRPERRTSIGPIFFFTAALEGFDEFDFVELVDGGVAILCTLRSGFTYRVPVEYIATWPGKEHSSRRAVAVHGETRGQSVELELPSGAVIDVSTSGILRYCEPLYVDASPRDGWEEELLRSAFARYGQLRVAPDGLSG